MRYYEVFVAENGYHKPDPLTYCFEGRLEAGTLVLVPFGRKTVSGFVSKGVEKPGFKAKPITGVLAETPLPSKTIALHARILEYYAGGSGPTTQLFVPSGLNVKPRKNSGRPKTASQDMLPELTPQQSQAIGQIEESSQKSFLLHGETGSGKTRVYLELARKSIGSGRSSMILVPEISLVPQTAGIFEDRFGDIVVPMHSGMTKSARNRNWLRILGSKEPVIVVGTRSALFAPVKDIGFIAVDEMHEPAYKQDSAPRYYGLRVAAMLAKLHGAITIYGSATPPVVEYFVAEQTGIPVLRLDRPAKQTGKTGFGLVDIRDTKQFSRHRFLSDTLLSAIEKRLSMKEQSLVFLNRRGSFRAVLCQNCGWQAVCPRCDLPLTYHGDKHEIRCHTCGYASVPPYACPDCGSDDITYRSLGTKALVEVLQTFFPEALIRRFDTDNLAEDRLGRHFDAVKSGEVDILVGTQMLSKGLDLPKLSLVGIVNADTSLNMPDFSSNERSYQLLHQTIGRVGRGHIGGEVIIQTFHPENPTLAAAISQDWKKLYELELIERQRFGFPPFFFLLKLSVSRKTEKAAEEFTGKLYSRIMKMPLKIRVDEPTPSFYEKNHGQYNWQLVIRAKDRSQLVKLVKELPSGDFTYDLDPLNLL